ncbi:multidrug effflux MFS transporter [Bacillus sp. FJAT-45350]|uniref:multidrug effflux MFS transporter n=1 Tax=Bacillus sp. FJAT-45350 TaxID=2011014 RepID=UPI000BB9996B|nr:multidrug effflux MFS transporter [Bacillus sp. FJAT-45350]
MKSEESLNSISSVYLNRTWLIFLLGALTAFGPLTIDMYLPAFPILTSDLQTTSSFTQLSLTACLLGLAVGQLIFGTISDIKGRKKPLIIALTIYTISSLLCTFAPSIYALISLRFIQGLAGAGGIVIARACVRDLYSGPELTKKFALLTLVMGAAPILAPIIGGLLLQFSSWRGIFLTLTTIGFILLVIVLFLLPETLSNENRLQSGIKNTFSTFKGLVRSRPFMGYALTQALITAAMFAYIAGSPFVFQNIFGVSPQMYSLFFACNAAGIIIASQVAGRLAGKVRETVLLRRGLLFAVSGGFLLLTFTLVGAGLLPIFLSLFIAISSVGLINATCFSLALQQQGRNAGSASALIGLLQFTIGGAVAPFVGIGGSETALPMAIAVALCTFGAVVIYLILVRKEQETSLHTQNNGVS